MKKKRISFELLLSFDYDPNFWALTPAININIHRPQFEIEWLCFALYIYKNKTANVEYEHAKLDVHF